MYKKEEEYKTILSNSLRVAIVSYNIESKLLSNNIQQKVINDNKKKIEFSCANNIEDLYKKKLYIEEHDNGLLNKNWIYNVTYIIPSVFIVYYQILVGVNKENEEEKIYKILEEIRKHSANCLILLIIVFCDPNIASELSFTSSQSSLI